MEFNKLVVPTSEKVGDVMKVLNQLHAKKEIG
jgi:hypothetical protein